MKPARPPVVRVAYDPDDPVHAVHQRLLAGLAREEAAFKERQRQQGLAYSRAWYRRVRRKEAG